MQTFQDRLYHYEATPPEKTWDDIADKLYNEKVVDIHRHGKRRLIYYGIAAAASIVILLLVTLFFNNNNPSQLADNEMQFKKSNNLSSQIIEDSIKLNQQILNSIINSPQEKKEITSNNFDLGKTLKKYLTIEGPSGEPVKISPKVATLILYADNEYPPKPIWSNEIKKWQKIMLNTTVSPTSTNLLDMVTSASNNNIE
ncbi:MAG: hypothetical protein ABI288_00480 [Ginsengibacter sp.]